MLAVGKQIHVVRATFSCEKVDLKRPLNTASTSPKDAIGLSNFFTFFFLESLHVPSRRKVNLCSYCFVLPWVCVGFDVSHIVWCLMSNLPIAVLCSALERHHVLMKFRTTQHPIFTFF